MVKLRLAGLHCDYNSMCTPGHHGPPNHTQTAPEQLAALRLGPPALDGQSLGHHRADVVHLWACVHGVCIITCKGMTRRSLPRPGRAVTPRQAKERKHGDLFPRQSSSCRHAHAAQHPTRHPGNCTYANPAAPRAAQGAPPTGDAGPSHSASQGAGTVSAMRARPLDCMEGAGGFATSLVLLQSGCGDCCFSQPLPCH